LTFCKFPDLIAGLYTGVTGILTESSDEVAVLCRDTSKVITYRIHHLKKTTQKLEI
jgi:ribosomal protein L21E